MERRAFLQFLTAATAVGAVISPLAMAAESDPLVECAKRFANARRNNPVLAGWQSVKPPGTDWANCTLQGKWPQDLRGTLFRNGPGLFERGNQRYLHWFDGDGLVQAWQIGDKGVRHHSRFVQTPKHEMENQSNRFEVMAAGTTIKNPRAISGPDDVNTANISVMHLAGKTYALWEAGSAFEINADTLETIGSKTWRDDLEGVAFSAHPVYEPDGSIWNVGLFDRALVIYHVGADGQLITAKMLKLPRGGYMHSFTASESQLVFVLAPLVQVRNGGSFFEGLGWKPELGSFMITVPKADLDKPSFVEFASGAAYHYADAWDGADGSLQLRACWYKGDEGFIAPLQHYMQGKMTKGADLSAELVTLQVSADRKQVKLHTDDFGAVEFPIQTRLTRQSPLLLLRGKDQHQYGATSGLLYLDKNGKQLASYEFGDDYILEEQLYIKTKVASYAMGTIFNAKKARTGLVLFDLKKITDGPIAQAWLAGAMPLGFHGTFVPRAF
jgi:all-trans-8'-apo-beta-carotenal 15,15'-oxygenase